MADLTDVYVSQPKGVPEQLAVVQAIFGIRAWRAIRAIRRLIALSADDPIGILARHLFELSINVEYISTDTLRVSKRSRQHLTISDKLRLFTEFYHVEMHKWSGLPAPKNEVTKAREGRRALGIEDEWAWHGRGLPDLCKELDDAVPLNPSRKIRTDNYMDMCRILSRVFVHPSFRAHPWLDFSGGTPVVMRTWESEEVVTLALTYGVETMRFWDMGLGRPKRRMVSRLRHDIVKLLQHD